MSAPPLTKKAPPAGWRWAKLGDVCRIVAGSTPDSGNSEYWGGDIVWITPTDLGALSNKYIVSSGRRLTEAGYESCGTGMVPADSVVISSRAPIGHLAIAGIDLCTNQGCKALVPLDGVLNPLFLYYALKDSVQALRSMGTGTTFAEVSKTQLSGFGIAVPSIAEQRRIARVLDEHLTSVERARRACEEQLEAAKALPAAYLRSVFESSDARAWPRDTVGNLASLVVDGPHVTPTYVSCGVPFLTVRNIVGRQIDLSDVSYVSPEDHAEFSRRGKAERGDILYTKDGTLGVPCVVDTEMQFSYFVSVALIKPLRDRVDSRFLGFALESPQVLEQVKLLGAGAGLKHMVLKSIKALSVPVPPVGWQKRVAEMLGACIQESNHLIALTEDQRDAVGALPAALLRKAFNGEL